MPLSVEQKKVVSVTNRFTNAQIVLTDAEVREVKSLVQAARKDVIEVLASVPGNTFTAEYYNRYSAVIDQRLTELNTGIVSTLETPIKDSAAVAVEGLADNLEIYQVPMRPFITPELVTASLSMTTDLVTNVSVQEAGKIKGILQRGMLAKTSPADLIIQVAPNLKKAGPFRSIAMRAEAIVRTEFGRVYNSQKMRSMNQYAEQYGQAPGKMWIATKGERTRDWHLKANGQIVPWQEPFRVPPPNGEKMMFPHDPAASAGNTVLCRCSFGTVFIDWITFEGGKWKKYAIDPARLPAALKPEKTISLPTKPVAEKAPPGPQKGTASYRRQEIEDAEFDKVTNLGGGINESFVAENGIKVVFKPADGEWNPGETNPLWGSAEGVPWGTQPVREKCASIIDEMMELNMVPPTTIRTIEGKIGSAQEFVKGPASILNHHSELKGVLEKAPKEKTEGWLIFDRLIQNQDRHGGNFLINKATNEIFLIDNGASFSNVGRAGTLAPHQLNTLYRGKEISDHWIEKLEMMNDNKDLIRKRLEDAGLEKYAIDNFLVRLRDMLEDGVL